MGVPKTVVQTSERVIDVPSVLVEETLRENPTVQVVDVVRQVPKQVVEERVRQVPRTELAVQEVTSPRAINRVTQQVVAINQQIAAPAVSAGTIGVTQAASVQNINVGGYGGY